MDHGEWLLVDGVEFACTIGVTERERQAPQRVVVNLRIGLDFAKVKVSDAIQDTVDYRSATRAIIAAGQRSSFQLIEALAAHLGQVLLDGFPAIREVRVELWKPGALSTARTVGVVVAATRLEG